MNAMTTKGFGRANKVKRIASAESRATLGSEDAKLLLAGEGSDERTDPMNMMTDIKASGAAADQELPMEWEAALADYQTKRAICIAMPLDAADADDAVEISCQAMDHLIEKVPAPSVAAIGTKLRLAKERSEDFEGIFDEHWAGIMADIDRLATFDQVPSISSEFDSLVTRWVEASAALHAPSVVDDDAKHFHSADHQASAAIAAFPARSLEELATKMYMLALVECGQVGPGELRYETDEQYEETHLWRGIMADLPRLAPAVQKLIDGAKAREPKFDQALQEYEQARDEWRASQELHDAVSVEFNSQIAPLPGFGKSWVNIPEMIDRMPIDQLREHLIVVGLPQREQWAEAKIAEIVAYRARRDVADARLKHSETRRACERARARAVEALHRLIRTRVESLGQSAQKLTIVREHFERTDLPGHLLDELAKDAAALV